MKSAQRIDILMEKDQLLLLRKLSKKQNKSVSELIRNAVDSRYAKTPSEQKLLAVEKLYKVTAPAGAWKDMEKEIMKGSAR